MDGLLHRALSWIREPAFAVAGVTATEVSGSALAAPAWLIGVGQAAIVVVFTVKAVDKRLQRLHEAVNKTTGKVEIMEGKMDTLHCIKNPGESCPAIEGCGKGCGCAL